MPFPILLGHPVDSGLNVSKYSLNDYYEVPTCPWLRRRGQCPIVSAHTEGNIAGHSSSVEPARAQPCKVGH